MAFMKYETITISCVCSTSTRSGRKSLRNLLVAKEIREPAPGGAGTDRSP